MYMDKITIAEYKLSGVCAGCGNAPRDWCPKAATANSPYDIKNDHCNFKKEWIANMERTHARYSNNG